MARLISVVAASALLLACPKPKVCDVNPDEAKISLAEQTPAAKGIRDELQVYNTEGKAPEPDQLAAYCENKWRLVLGKYCPERVNEHCKTICQGSEVDHCKGDGRHRFVAACAKLSLQPFRDVMTRCNAGTLDANNNLVMQ